MPAQDQVFCVELLVDPAGKQAVFIKVAAIPEAIHQNLRIEVEKGVCEMCMAPCLDGRPGWRHHIPRSVGIGLREAQMIKVPSEFARRIICPEAHCREMLFGQARSTDAEPVFVPVPVERRQKLGTVSHFVEKSKADRDKLSLNPVAGGTDVAMLDPDHDLLSIRFSLAVQSDAASPHACVDVDYAAAVRRFAAIYGEQVGYRPLAERYVRSILSGRWTWRNRLLAEGGTVTITTRYRDIEPVTVEMADLPARFEDELGDEMSARLADLIDAFASSLAGGAPLLLEVDGRLRMLPGAEVYPTQRFLDKEIKGRTLHVRRVGSCDTCAAFHEQKIGAALRQIDTWHGGYVGPNDGIEVVAPHEPIIVNPWGQDRRRHVILRDGPKRNSLKSLLEGLPGLSDDLEADHEDTETLARVNFVMACIFRGGLYGGKE